MNDLARTFDWDTFLHNVDALIADEGSQEQFCVNTGVRFWTVNGWRQGRYIEPKHSTLQTIADHYDMSVDDLVSKRLPKRPAKT